MKILSKCEICRKRRLWIQKRQVRLPVGITAISQKQMCGRCNKKLTAALASNQV